MKFVFCRLWNTCNKKWMSVRSDIHFYIVKLINSCGEVGSFLQWNGFIPAVEWNQSLLYNDKVVLLLALLNEEVLAIEEVGSSEKLVWLSNLLLVDADTTTLNEGLHLTL